MTPVCNECGAEIDAEPRESPLEATLAHYEEAHDASWMQ